MKRIVCALICLIFLCACSGGKVPRAVNRNISYRAHIFYYDKEYECDVKIDKEGRAEYTLREGVLDGFTACYFGDSVTLSYMEKENPQPYSYPAGGMLSALYEMNEFLSGTCEVREKDEEYFVVGQTSIGEFTLFLSGAGLPLNAELDGQSFYVEFYDVSLTKEE